MCSFFSTDFVSPLPHIIVTKFLLVKMDFSNLAGQFRFFSFCTNVCVSTVAGERIQGSGTFRKWVCKAVNSSRVCVYVWCECVCLCLTDIISQISHFFFMYFSISLLLLWMNVTSRRHCFQTLRVYRNNPPTNHLSI